MVEFQVVPADLPPIYSAGLEKVRSGTLWTDLSFLVSEVEGSMGTVLARSGPVSARDVWSAVRAEHPYGAYLVEQGTSWDGLRRWINRRRPDLEREARELWGVTAGAVVSTTVLHG